MKLTLLGTGCPVVSTSRFGPAHWIEQGETHLLVDCGSGVTQRMLAAGYSARELDAVLLTHLHSDHIVDLFQLVISSWHQGRQAPMRVFGPTGTRRYVDGLMEVWRPELEQRIAWEQRSSTEALRVDVTELDAERVVDFGGLRAAFVEVEHGPVKPAFGIVFSAGDERLALSGDTSRCDRLIDAAKDVDVLVHEVCVHREMPAPGGIRTVDGMANVASYHTGSHEVGAVATECGAGALVLTHFVPPNCDRDDLLDEVARSFDGPVVVGEDLMTIDVGRRVVSHASVRLALGLPTSR